MLPKFIFCVRPLRVFLVDTLFRLTWYTERLMVCFQKWNICRVGAFVFLLVLLIKSLYINLT